jgi:hypothetical protein
MLVLMPRRPLSHSNCAINYGEKIHRRVCKTASAKQYRLHRYRKQIKIYHYQLQIRLFEFHIRRRTRTSHNSDVAAINL